MFADPQSITVNSVAKSMPRVMTKDLSAQYQTDDQLFKLLISHQMTTKNRVRSLARFDQRKIVTNPLDSTKQDWDFCSVSIVIDRPEFGWSAAEVDYLVAGFKAWLDTTADAKLFGLQS